MRELSDLSLPSFAPISSVSSVRDIWAKRAKESNFGQELTPSQRVAQLAYKIQEKLYHEKIVMYDRFVNSLAFLNPEGFNQVEDLLQEVILDLPWLEYCHQVRVTNMLWQGLKRDAQQFVTSMLEKL